MEWLTHEESKHMKISQSERQTATGDQNETCKVITTRKSASKKSAISKKYRDIRLSKQL